jgi:hypothetical protein
VCRVHILFFASKKVIFFILADFEDHLAGIGNIKFLEALFEIMSGGPHLLVTGVFCLGVLGGDILVEGSGIGRQGFLLGCHEVIVEVVVLQHFLVGLDSAGELGLILFTADEDEVFFIATHHQQRNVQLTQFVLFNHLGQFLGGVPEFPLQAGLIIEPLGIPCCDHFLEGSKIVLDIRKHFLGFGSRLRILRILGFADDPLGLGGKGFHRILHGRQVFGVQPHQEILLVPAALQHVRIGGRGIVTQGHIDIHHIGKLVRSGTNHTVIKSGNRQQ